MKGVSELHCFSEHELALFRRATQLVALLPEKDQHDEILRCHEVARVVGHMLDLEVIDGRYEYGAEHSWCIITQVTKFRSFSILDPYAIGRLPIVQMYYIAPTIPNRYFPEARRSDIKQDVVEHLLGYFRSRRKKT